MNRREEWKISLGRELGKGRLMTWAGTEYIAAAWKMLM